MRPELDQVVCASLPLDALATLADLRRAEGISVTLAGDRAWVRWEPGNHAALRTVLPLPGSELFVRRGKHWYKLGSRLPSFNLPIDQRGVVAVPLHSAVVPRPVRPEPPGEGLVATVALSLVRDDRIRTASALKCPIAVLGRWADSAPTARFAGLLAAKADDVVIVVGRSLPVVAGPGVERFWGSRVLAPLGLRPEPSLPEHALRRALGIADDELPLLIASPDGSAEVEVELVPYAALRPLSRAGVRLALTGATDLGGIDAGDGGP
jgi:hypothetical protein